MRRANKSLLIGLTFGVMLITGAIAHEINGLSAAVFIHPVAIMIVFGGCIASAAISVPLVDLGRILKRTYYCIFHPKNNFTPALQEIVRISVGVNRDVLFLEKELQSVRNAMLYDGLNLISMGFKTEDIKRFMDIKRDQNEVALAECSLLYFSIAKMGPAFGLLGTLVGLIILLYYHMGEGNMEKVASSMGVALTATLYGVGLANMVFSPLADYLQYNAERGAQIDSMIIEAIVQIKERRHPVYLMQALKAYLPREDYPMLEDMMRAEMAQNKGKTEGSKAA